MKRLSIVILTLLFIIGTYTFASAKDLPFSTEVKKQLNYLITMHIEDPKVIICGKEAKHGAKNILTYSTIRGDRTLVSLGFMWQNFGAKIKWNQEEQKVTITNSGNKIEMQLDNNIIKVNGVEKEIDVPAQRINGRVYVPLRATLQIYETGIFWDDRKIVIISNKDNVIEPKDDSTLINEVNDYYNSNLAN